MFKLKFVIFEIFWVLHGGPLQQNSTNTSSHFRLKSFEILKFTAKVHWSISQGLLHCTPVQDLNNFKNDKFEFKHLKTNLETIINPTRVQEIPIPLLTYNIFFPFFSNFQKFWEWSIFVAFPTKFLKLSVKFGYSVPVYKTQKISKIVKIR